MRRLAVVIVLASAFVAGSVFADARQHFMAGQDYYTQGRYQKAIDEFQEAYRLDPRPLLLFNIAQAYEKLGLLQETVDYLKKFLEAEPDSDERTTLLNKIAVLEARIAKTGIKVTVNEAEATVYVDGVEKGKTPVAEVIPLAVGAHKVKIAKKGFKDFEMNLAVSSGQTTPVEAKLEPGVSGPAPVAPPPKGEDEGEGETEEEEGGIEPLDIVPWGIAGVGAVAAIVGFGVIGGMANAAQPDDPKEDPDAQNDAHKKAVIADAIGWPGVALAAAGTIWGVLRLTGGEDDEEPLDDEDADVAVLPILGNDAAGVAAVVQF